MMLAHLTCSATICSRAFTTAFNTFTVTFLLIAGRGSRQSVSKLPNFGQVRPRDDSDRPGRGRLPPGDDDDPGNTATPATTATQPRLDICQLQTVRPVGGRTARRGRHRRNEGAGEQQRQERPLVSQPFAADRGIRCAASRSPARTCGRLHALAASQVGSSEA